VSKLTLDVLLEAAREPEPIDDLFVARVMTDVRTGGRRTPRGGLRRPIVIGIAAAVMVTGGTVAALVGTNPSHRPPAASHAPAPVHVSSQPRSTVTVSAAPAPAVRPAAPRPVEKVVQQTEGFLTDHTAYILDAKTGLRLKTETYTNDLTVGKDHRVTLTLENTGTRTIRFSAQKDCALQVMAFPKGTNSSTVYQSPDNYKGNFDWVCAGSDYDPRAQPLTERFELAPGERKTADAYINLDDPGEWKVVGMCRCSYSQKEAVGSSPQPKSDPLTELFRRTLPAQLLPEQYDNENLISPGIIVDAER